MYDGGPVRVRLLLVGAVIAALVVVGKAQKAADADWPMYARDLAGTKYSPLTQINADNVSKLTPAWNVTLVERPAGGRGTRGAGAPPAGEEGAAPADGRGRGPAAPPILSNPEVTPIVVNGVMYLDAGGDHILALDAATGKEIWRFQLPGGDTTGRGVAYWPGDRNNPERIFFTASPPNMKAGGGGFNSGAANPPSRLMALDAATGKPSEGFGTSGVADINVGWNGVPVVLKNVIALGATVGEVPVGPPGDTRADDARTGKKLWEFHTVPRPGERGNETWQNDSWKGRSGVNVWGWYMTADVERGILYMPVAGPAANYWGGDRPGNNLYANSIVAVDAETGKYKWHFQTVHHDIWDSDMPSPPTLVEIRQNGRTIPALASVGKTGYMFILDRVTGKPIFGVEERPVPKGDVPGGGDWPTHPFPAKPPPTAPVGFRGDDMR